MATIFDKLDEYKANPKNIEDLNKIKQLFDNRDVEGMIALIKNPDVDPVLKLAAWGESQKNLDFMVKVHDATKPVLIDLALAEINN